ncbi:MAG TPA: Ig-like domain-containing protein [Acidiphilium sp.]|jgi:nucleoid-associated protein YgaU|uniref:Ig-like domain-containing protein n=1 Tax=unclassified Acidiphilium TaxID=2617493 RepID=UPI000BDA3AE1|nr:MULTISPECIES: Ig-like domain-containing protein [unclassified Acidiphilium]OYV55121.1 MAG: peptidoglycan-binding protein [Acidiphilium sp. 20-67-58]HQT61628.1 Ig-like domain-containing protein [Acidiphilium sp.]HQU10923.1 Ig-like domain-containing protein [Acidiphilium sp.]
MPTNETPSSDNDGTRARLPGWLPGAAIGALGLCAVLGLVVLSNHRKPETAPPAAATAPAAAPAAPATPAPPAAPRFDTVRVDAGGNAVIAGHAAPGATVTITANGRTIGTVKADSSGSFAFVTDHPLPAGGQQLALAEATPGGGTRTSRRDVTVAVPAAPNEGPLAVLAGNGSKPSRVLSGQGPAPGTLGIGSVDYGASGKAVIAGTAKPGATVSLSLDGKTLGSATAGADGRWTMKIGQMPTKPGTFSLKAQDAKGGVIGEMKTAYAPRPLGKLVPHEVVVARGECLWLIARRVYGRGTDYTMIYRANEASIRDPNLVYPGQRFLLPQSPGMKAAPAAPAKSTAPAGTS